MRYAVPSLSLSWLIAAVYWLGASRGIAEEPLTLRVVSYNIHHAEGTDGRLDLERIARVIQSARADLVALQEVDRNVNRSNVVDQPAKLASLTGMEVAFGANLDLQGGQYGNAILSRFPIASSKNHKLPRLEEGEQRGVLAAEIRLPPPWAPLSFLATHLDHRRGDDERVASARVLNELAERRETRPALLAGDLNALPDSEPLAELRKQWTMANSAPLHTVPVAEPSRQIDYVLFRPPGNWRVAEARVLPEAVASDHRAVLVVLELSRP